MDSEVFEHMGNMKTLSEVIDVLISRGYTLDFNLKSDQIIGHESDINTFPDKFLIDGHYRFEGASDPEDEAIVYAISSIDGQIKGVLVNGYGNSSDSATEAIIEKLHTRKDLDI